MDGGEVDESVIEELALIKTLRGIVEWVEDRSGDEAAPATAAARPRPAIDEVPSGGTPERFVPVLDPLPEPAGDDGAGLSLAGAAVAIVDDGGGVGAALHALLVERAARATLVAAGDPVPEGTATLVDLGALAAGAGDTGAVVAQFARLRQAAGAGAGRLLVATGRGGDLGLGDGAPPPARRATAGAAAAGMVRTFARELAAVRSQVVDVDPGAGPATVAGALLAELRTGDGPVEVGYRAGGRWTITTAARPLDAEAGTEVAADEAHQLGPGSVVVVTGGGRGIGARLAAGLARATGCGIELVGRSPLPGDEPAHLAGAADSVALRRAIIGRGELARPAEIEAEVARVLAAREIRATLADLAAHAAFVDYRSLDVRDAPALAAALEDVRGRRGRLDGVIHAAGIREDKLIRDKEPDSFARVYDTKVGPALAAIEAVGPGGLVVLFASVSGAFGNAGQVDYAAANSVLDGLARRARQAAAGSRLLAIDWGPWAGTGMVTPELAREYERRGVGLVEPDAGVAAALAELRAGVPDAQVVLMCASPVALGA
jgi:NAD(P)-dependent dehydrogenase (short-subunit alcohol dehydrogenase family)